MEKFYSLIKGNKPVLVEFFASWCPHCQRMHPVLNDLKTQADDKLIIEKFDIDTHTNEPLVAYYQIYSIPTLILFKGGEQIWRQSGEMKLEQLNGILKKYMV